MRAALGSSGARLHVSFGRLPRVGVASFSVPVFGGSLVFPRGSLYPSEGSVAVRGLPFVFPFAAVAVPLVWPGFRTAGKQGLFFTVAALYQGPNGNVAGVRGTR